MAVMASAMLSIFVEWFRLMMKFTSCGPPSRCAQLERAHVAGTVPDLLLRQVRLAGRGCGCVVFSLTLFVIACRLELGHIQ